jgi:hypothetical protein
MEGYFTISFAGHKDDSLLTPEGLTQANTTRKVILSAKDTHFGSHA